ATSEKLGLTVADHSRSGRRIQLASRLALRAGEPRRSASAEPCLESVRITVAAGMSWKSAGVVSRGAAVRADSMLHSVQLLSKFSGWLSSWWRRSRGQLRKNMSPHRCGSGLWGNLIEESGIFITTR